jgi:hypothetical protein
MNQTLLDGNFPSVKKPYAQSILAELRDLDKT